MFYCLLAYHDNLGQFLEITHYFFVFCLPLCRFSLIRVCISVTVLMSLDSSRFMRSAAST